jgi:hypothetical protein
MSDQGDTGQWRPATSQNDHHSVPEDTTGPLPAVSEDEDDAPGFPSPGGPSESWSAATDDDAPTGGFPAVSSSEEPYSPTGRSPFEPVARTERRAFDLPPEPDAEGESEQDPDADGTTPAFGTRAQGARPARSSFGRGVFDEPESSAETSFGEPSFGSGASSFGARSFGDFGSTAFDDRPEASYAPETGTPGSDAGSAPPPRPPAPAKNVSDQDEADENDFFASDDHPPMWDKVVAPSGPPPKPGKPSSGNLRLPDWMRDENGGASGGAARPPVEDEDDGRSRRPMFVGVGLLVVGLVAAGGAYVVKGGGDTSNAAAPSRPTTAPSPSATRSAQSPAQPQKPLPRFRGTHSKVIGRVTDARSGLSYPRLAKPWATPAKRSPMTELGFGASQFVVTENSGGQPTHWARLMSAELGGAAKDDYAGPGSEREAATRVAQMYEERMYGFRHKKRSLASQPLDIDGHKGWLVSDYLTFRRPGLKATGDVVALALVDTGHKAPGILLMSAPNTDKKLWPDVNFVVRSLKLA